MLPFQSHHQEFAPPEELRETIKCFWYDKINLGDEQSDFEVVPDGYAEIIFHFGSSCNIYNNGVLQPLPSPFVVGLLNQPVHFYIENQLEIIAIRCFPWTVFDLLGLPSGKQTLHTFEHPIARLHPVLEKFIHAGRIDDAVNCVKQYFEDTKLSIVTDLTLSKAGVAMKDSNGNLPVSQVAEAANATVRTLERKFKQSSGHTVKDVSGLMRFEKVRNQLWFDPDISLAGLAHELGYTDQSHLSREFKRYSGTTPAVFARKAKKGKLAVAKNPITFVKP